MRYINYENNEEITIEQARNASVIDRTEDTIYFINVKTVNEIRINQLKQNLADTDYKAIKYAEGELTAEEYEPIKQQRREWRAEINRLESEVRDVNL